jgi:NTP pyrophosphatase (non-canonical NTP hydrolase)
VTRPGRQAEPASSTTIAAFQRRIEDVYGERDARRGVEGTFVWFVEEVGELARALQRRDPANLREEFADVLAWLTTLASLTGVDMAAAAGKYAAGCPRCHATPCACPERRGASYTPRP